MMVKVICGRCHEQTDWKWGKQSGVCDNCDEQLTVKEVKLAEGELWKLFQA